MKMSEATQGGICVKIVCLDSDTLGNDIDLNAYFSEFAEFISYPKTEPMKKNHPFLDVKNKHRLLITPHIAWASVEARKRLLNLIVKNIKDFIKG